MGLNVDATSLSSALEENVRLDSSGPLWLLRQEFGYSLDDIDGLAIRYIGKRLPKASISRFLNRQGTARTLPGIAEIAIHEMAFTPSRMAHRMLIEECRLREAFSLHSSGGQDPRCLREQMKQAKSAIKAERGLIKELSPVGEERSDRSLDIAAVDFCEGQVFIFSGRLATDRSEKLAAFSRGSILMGNAAGRLRYAVEAGRRSAEIVDLMLAVNAVLNRYFAAYEVDDLEREPDFARARAAAAMVANPLFLRAGHAVASLQRDPRIAFNLASAAGLANNDGAAAEFLQLATKIDGYGGRDIVGWSPAWLAEPLADSKELASAIQIIDRKWKYGS